MVHKVGNCYGCRSGYTTLAMDKYCTAFNSSRIYGEMIKMNKLKVIYNKRKQANNLLGYQV